MLLVVWGVENPLRPEGMSQLCHRSVGECNTFGKKVLKRLCIPVLVRKKSFEKVLKTRPSWACRSVQQGCHGMPPAVLSEGCGGFEGVSPSVPREEPVRAVEREKTPRERETPSRLLRGCVSPVQGRRWHLGT